MRVCFFCLIFMAMLPLSAYAQGRCGTVEYEKKLERQNPKRTEDGFERWMAQHVNQQLKNSQRAERTQTTLTIPVVVHIIHNGEPVGTGLNISDAQVFSQMVVLNNDFNRLNADQANTPTLFQPVAGSFDVQFVLAKQDPNGIATTGIVRVQGSKTSWSFNDDFLLKSQSYWPAEQYLNVWVSSITDFLGYAQFPVSSLPGLADSPIERLTDGIVVNYRHFGSIDGGTFDLSSRYNKGRTLTHEMGHFFGLRHIWGDVSSCSTATDYVDDTPVQNSSTNGCPAHPQTSCSNTKMFQNYLDYTDDACMNIFTQGQVVRMNFVAANSPRRKELPNSIGSLPPTVTSPVTDLKLVKLESPAPVTCSLYPSIKLRIRNVGTTTVNSLTCSVSLGSGGTSFQPFSGLALAPNAETIIEVMQPRLILGENQLTVNILSPNGIADQNALDNTNVYQVVINDTRENIPLRERFDSNSLQKWTIVSQQQQPSWAKTSTNYQQSLAYNSFSNTTIGANSWLVSPILDLTNNTEASVFFDASYAKRINGCEKLRVLASTDCGVSYTDILFDQIGSQLAVTDSEDSWKPVLSSDWKNNFINLQNYVGQANARIAFVAVNGNGNNLYLDNIDFFADNSPTQLKVESPYAVYGATGTPVKITFNLEERQTVGLQIYNSIGQLVVEENLPETINQTYSVDLSDRGVGVYIIRLQMAGQLSARKVYIGN
jgi:hypothetical protein